jgi:uncharacterized protein
MLEFEWDQAKSARNIAVRELGFDQATLAFDDPNRTCDIDEREDYGEVRYLTLGLIGGRLSCVVYTLRGDVVRIISARWGNRKERIRYGHRQGAS